MFRQAGVPLDIHQVFMNVDITREGDMIDEIIEGLTIQASETAAAWFQEICNSGR